jgi:xanthine dehydrogenase molybdopterin-binding subunit B
MRSIKFMLQLLSQELHLYAVQSTEPHARFTVEDVTEALAVPGAVAWISHTDIQPGRQGCGSALI